MEIWHPAGALASWTQPRGGSFRLDLLHAIMNCLPIFYDWYRHDFLPIRLSRFQRPAGVSANNRYGDALNVANRATNRSRYARRFYSTTQAIRA